jgi:hypothetical protein
MAITFDFSNRIVISSSSITDGVLFHSQLRDAEASELGMQYPRIHDYRQIQLGGGAVFPSIVFVNGWQLTMPSGVSEISGFNLEATITNSNIVKVVSSAAYAVTSVGSSGTTPEQLATAIWDDPNAEVLIERMRRVWQRHGLDIGNPVTTHGQSEIIFSDIVIELTESGANKTMRRTV